MIECMDRGIARVLDALDQAGLADNTLVMFSSDNGPQFGGKGEMCTDRFNCGFAGSKLLVYEGGIRLPMVMRWPAGLDGRRQVHEMVHFTDWLPTILALAGASRRAISSSTESTCVQLCRASAARFRLSVSGNGTATRPTANAMQRCATVDGNWCAPRFAS